MAIQKQSVLITVTLQGYIKRGALDIVKKQKRGGKGKSGIKTRDEDSVVQTLSVNTHTSVLFFSIFSIIDKDTILSLSPKLIPLIPLEDLPLNNLNFFDSNLIHFPFNELSIIS